MSQRISNSILSPSGVGKIKEVEKCLKDVQTVKGWREVEYDIDDFLPQAIAVDYVKRNYSSSLEECSSENIEEMVEKRIEMAELEEDEGFLLDEMLRTISENEEKIRNRYHSETDGAFAGDDDFAEKFIEKEYAPKVILDMYQRNQIDLVPVEPIGEVYRGLDDEGKNSEYSIGLKLKDNGKSQSDSLGNYMKNCAIVE